MHCPNTFDFQARIQNSGKKEFCCYVKSFAVMYVKFVIYYLYYIDLCTCSTLVACSSLKCPKTNLCYLHDTLKTIEIYLSILSCSVLSYDTKFISNLQRGHILIESWKCLVREKMRPHFCADSAQFHFQWSTWPTGSYTYTVCGMYSVNKLALSVYLVCHFWHQNFTRFLYVIRQNNRKLISGEIMHSLLKYFFEFQLW